MSLLNRFTLKSRLMTLLLGVSLGSLLIAGIFSYLQFRKAFEKEISQRLIGIRAAKSNKIELYMRDLRSHVEILSEDRMVTSAMVEFNSAYEALKDEVIPPQWSEAIENYYKTKFLPKLSANIQGEQLFANYNPASQVSQYLQYHYIANNPFTVGEKSQLANSKDSSDYSKFHSKYHPFFAKLLKKFGYYDLFLIDFASGEVVYSVTKQTDYATSLNRGPYRRSGLAKVVEAVRDNPGKGFVQIVDFQPYAPSYGLPAIFLAAPIYNGPHLIGILAIDLPVDKIDFLLTSNNNWEEEGLGKTGQVYLVGSDLLMRSDARMLLEDPDKYFKNLRQTKISSQTINFIKKLKTSILLQSVETKAGRGATSDVTATEIIDNYREVNVVSSYAPLRLEGLDWGIIAEIDREEAFKPIYSFQIFFSVLSVILLLLISWLAALLSHNFIKPVKKLTTAAHQLKEGEDVQVELGRRQDELGELSSLFNDVAKKINTQQNILRQKNQENATLLANILPDLAIAQWQQGHKQIVDNLSAVTILYATIAGINSLNQKKSPSEIGIILNQLVTTCDRLAVQYGLEKQNTIWNSYVVVSGLSVTCFDQQEKTVNFALKMVDEIERINRQHQVNLGWRIAIDSGNLMAGVVGEERFAYKFWGKLADTVINLNPQGAYNSIIVTESIKSRLSDRYLFVSSEEIKVEARGTIPSWMLISATASFSQQAQLVQTSFTKLLPQADATAKLFYERLFTIAPEVRPLFKGDLTRQQRKFMNTLQVAVNSLTNLPELLSTVQALGRQHGNYKVKEEQYETVGKALIWTLEKQLGEYFTPEVRQAWKFVYTLLSSIMKEAAKSGNKSQDLVVN